MAWSTLTETGHAAQRLTDHLPDALILLEPAGRLVWANKSFSQKTGCVLQDAHGRLLTDLLSVPADRVVFDELWAVMMRDGCSQVIEQVALHRDGVEEVFSITLIPSFASNGALEEVVAIMREAPHDRAAHQASIDLRAYRRALDQQAIVSVTDPRGTITYVNGKFSQISGYAPEELIGHSHRIVNSGTHDSGYFREMWSTIRAGRTWHGEICNRAKNGSLYWVDTTVVPVNDEQGYILRYVSVRYDITVRKEAEQALRYHAEYDTLTGLANRNRFHDELRTRLASANAGGLAGIVALLDLDHFKDLNDTLGHHYGDLLLRQIGKRLSDLAGEGAVVARLGGDEFGAILMLDPKDSAIVLSRLHRNASAILSLEGIEYLPAFSMGVASFPYDGRDIDTVLMNADIALYAAKRNGRNQWGFFDREDRNRLEYRERIKTALVAALDDATFDIVMQPTIETATGCHNGFEVLVRLVQESQPIPPDHFIPLAEELGMIGRSDPLSWTRLCGRMPRCERKVFAPASSPSMWRQPSCGSLASSRKCRMF